MSRKCSVADSEPGQRGPESVFKIGNKNVVITSLTPHAGLLR